MDFKIGLVVLILGIFGATKAEKLRIDGDPVVVAQRGRNLTVACKYEGSAGTLLRDAVDWYVRQYGTTDRLLKSTNGGLVGNVDKTKYSTNILCDLEGGTICKVTLTVINIQDSDDGAYICQLRVKSNGEIITDKTIDVQVFNPIEQLDLMISNIDDKNKNEKIMSTQAKKNQISTVNLDHGKYRVECLAKNSNPKPTVTIKDFSGTTLTVQKENRDLSRDKRRYQQSVIGTIEIEKDSENKIIECKGIVENVAGSALTAGLRVGEVITRDPHIKCSNSTALLNDKNREITCVVHVEEGPISCSSATWMEGDNIYKHEQDYPTVEVICDDRNKTHLVTTLTVTKRLKEDDFKTTYVFEFNQKGYSTLRKEVLIKQYFSTASYIYSHTSVILCLVVAVFRTLL